MRKAKCQNGHFYDADSWNQCPHCGAVEMSQAAAPTTLTQQTGVRSTGVQQSGFRASVFPSSVEPTTGSESTGKQEWFSWKKDATEKPEERPRKPFDDFDKTLSLYAVEEQPTAPEQIRPTQSVTDLNGVKTVSLYTTEDNEEPVTGWLVGVAGKYYGRSFELRTGQNFIGRDAAMTVVLEKDESVSRRIHAIVLFEPRKSVFYLQNGESSGLTYCNDELVCGSVVLKAYDRILVGGTELLFIPLCSEQFRWDHGGDNSCR